MNIENNKGDFIITKRIIEISVVSGATDATSAEKMYIDNKGVVMKRTQSVDVSPREESKPETAASGTPQKPVSQRKA